MIDIRLSTKENSEILRTLYNLLILCVLLFTSLSVSAQQYTINGYVKDASNGEALIGAYVLVEELEKGTATNEYGFFSLTIEPGTYTLKSGYLGYAEFGQKVELNQNVTINIELSVESTVIEEVVVKGDRRDQNVRGLQMSTNKLSMGEIKKLPSLLGETDVLRGILVLPGITTVGEGAAGFNVRGGSIDQNLVLLDEAPVYNSSHLFGFFSVFNPDAVKDVKLYKGGIPARYGGRLSSILDVRMKEGNNKQFEMNGGIGTIFSRLSIEAPIVKDKASFIVAGRRSYIDVLAAPFLGDDLDGTALNFYDLTLKTNYRFSDKDQVFLSGYFGRDNFSFGDAAGFSWGNSTATMRWNHLFNEKLFANVTGYYSDYEYQINFGDTEEDQFDWNAHIKNLSIKPELSYYVNPNNVIRFGGQMIYYVFEPANALAITDNDFLDISVDRQYSLESAVFIENELSLFENLKVNYGLRFSHFAYLGGRNVYSYGEPGPGLIRPVEEIEFVEKGKTVESYGNFEPRLSVKYDLGESSSIKASYNRTAQYIHLLSNTTASTPLDIWTPSTNNIRPATANQIAAGYFRNFDNDNIEFSAEVYYKKTNRIIDYVDGADLILNEFLEGQILEGEARAYGAEFFLRRNSGRLNGWISYTLARSERLVTGINNNEWYPNRFDQTHNFSVTAFYELSPRSTLSANFVFNTGTPTTFASTRYTQQGYIIPNNDGNMRNNLRIPSYHRLDLSWTIGPNPKKDKKWKGEWVFGLYNVYARRNPFTIFFRQAEGRPVPGQEISTEAIRLSVVGSIIPAISYNFTLK